MACHDMAAGQNHRLPEAVAGSGSGCLPLLATAPMLEIPTLQASWTGLRQLQHVSRNTQTAFCQQEVRPLPQTAVCGAAAGMR